MQKLKTIMQEISPFTSQYIKNIYISRMQGKDSKKYKRPKDVLNETILV